MVKQGVEQGNDFIEKEIKRSLIKLHQNVFGKGPEEILVNVTPKFISFYLSKTLTDIERFLLKTPDGKSIVQDARKKILDYLASYTCPYLENSLSIRFTDFSTGFSLEKDIIFGIMIYEENST